MSAKLSLSQSWVLLILLSFFVPVLGLTFWFGYQLYNEQLNSALKVEQKANEAVRDQIQSELKRIKSVLHNKADPLVLLVDKTNSSSEMNRYLSLILEREPAVFETALLSIDGTVIAAVDPSIGIGSDHEQTTEQLQMFKQHLGIDSLNQPPELVIPLFGRDYIGSPAEHSGFMSFLFATPIGIPTKAVMISLIDVNSLWKLGEQKVDEISAVSTVNYLLDRRGSLIASSKGTQHKTGELLTHLPITRTALTNSVWRTNESYVGINNHPVYGTMTSVNSLNWTLVSEVDASEITWPIWVKLVKVIFFLFPMFGLFVWLIFRLAIKTIKPIQAVCEATQEVAKGNYRVDLVPCGIKELDVLSSNFNIMAKARKASEEKLQLSDRVFRETHDGILITDKNCTIIDVNPTYCQVTGYSRKEILGRKPKLFSSRKHGPEFYQLMWKAINEEGHWQGEIWNRKKNGELFALLQTISCLTDDNGDVLYYVGVSSDITINKHQQEKLELMAHYDILTQLPNRALFADRFKQALAYCKRNKSLLAICFIDLDNFKPVNDTFGHDIGDQLLVEVAKRIKQTIREEDTVSRQGGDEFTMLLCQLESYEQCEQTLDRISHSLAQPFVIDDHPHQITFSCGVTLYPNDDSDIDTLVRHADQAMYRAKLAGKKHYHLFDPEKDQQTIHRFNELEQIQTALSNKEFQLHYQPKLNMKTGHVFGVEALIRWQHPEKGLLSPIEFLPVIEGTDLEVKIGDWVINQALTYLAELKKFGFTLTVSINISSLHLQSPSFLSGLEKALQRHSNVNPNNLELEILESSVLSNLQSISEIINTCRKKLGLNIALDDFGTGYSSLTHLRNLAANTIKIDQSFVRDILEDPNDYSIIEGIISLADSFERKIIAEGVETTEQGLMLLLMGCEDAQGYGIAKPMPAAEIVNWLKAYIPNKKWIAYGNKKRTLKQRKLEILKLNLTQWLKHFVVNIESSPANIKKWPEMEQEKSACGVWIRRGLQEQLFEDTLFDELSKNSKALYAVANNLLNEYQHGEIELARNRFSPTTGGI